MTEEQKVWFEADTIHVPASRVFGPCPKCGSGQVDVKWFPKGDTPRHISQPLTEHLRVTCGRCGYAWSELPLDQRTDDATT